MTKIGLISDTHGYLDEQVFDFFKDCDQIWHAGDFGDLKIFTTLNNFKPTKAVYGNIDSKETQWQLPEDLIFEVEEIKIFMTHIGALPPVYAPRVRKIIDDVKPNIFVCGHSHILRVIKDTKRPNLVYLNPGAAGNEGFHHVRTMMRFTINGNKIEALEVIELGKRGQILKKNHEKNT